MGTRDLLEGVIDACRLHGQIECRQRRAVALETLDTILVGVLLLCSKYASHIMP